MADNPLESDALQVLDLRILKGIGLVIFFTPRIYAFLTRD